MKPVRPDIGDMAMPLRGFEEHNHNHPGVFVTASVWLVLYCLMFSDFAVTQAAKAFASLY